MSDIVRLVVFQLECHPAFFRDRLVYLEEPFVPKSYNFSLSFLGSHGFPTTDLQEICKQEYMKWHIKRLQMLLKHPLLHQNIPCIIAFPEGSIPIDCLKMLRDFVASTNSTIIAGSHTILESIEAKKIYSSLGKADSLGKRHKYNHDVNFVFSGNKIHHQKKQGVSPLDRTDVTSLDIRPVNLHSIPINIGDSIIKMVSMVCADALQLPKIKDDYDLVSIVSYDSTEKHFENFIGTQVENSKVVIYCNDGKHGGSSINLPLDKRPTSWFFDGPFNGKLTKGDALLIIDIPSPISPTQVGITNPKPQMTVKILGSITYNDSIQKDHIVSKEISEIKNIQEHNVDGFAKSRTLKICQL